MFLDRGAVSAVLQSGPRVLLAERGTIADGELDLGDSDEDGREFVNRAAGLGRREGGGQRSNCGSRHEPSHGL